MFLGTAKILGVATVLSPSPARLKEWAFAGLTFDLTGALERDAVHLEEVDVRPDHGRRGLGTKLVLQVCRWAASSGYACVTLTTFRDVPWNMPFYARLGFAVVPPVQLSIALRGAVDNETRRGLDPLRRVVMRRQSS
jgi:GNAT superfamily N-acetyltransferase